MSIKIYTDGACKGNPGDGGWGALIIYPDNEEEIFGYEENTTNNRMELLAAIKALEAITEKKEVTIYTDSMYLQQGITSWINNWKLNNWRTASKKEVKNSDLLLISTPSSSFTSVIGEIKASLKSGSILTDTLSVKKGFEVKLDDVNWIPSHPVAGTEKSGPTAGQENLFENRWTIITPSKNTKESDIKKVSLFWETMGSKVKIMSPDEHEKIISKTSHLHHVIAYKIVKT